MKLKDQVMQQPVVGFLNIPNSVEKSHKPVTHRSPTKVAVVVVPWRPWSSIEGNERVKLMRMEVVFFQQKNAISIVIFETHFLTEILNQRRCSMNISLNNFQRTGLKA